MTVSRRPPVAPTGAAGLVQWAADMFRYLNDLSADLTAPQTVRLAHRRPSDKAIQDGVIMWDATANRPVVSVGGVWRTFTLDP